MTDRKPVHACTHPALRDAYGQPVTIRAREGYDGFGSQPYGICREVRNRVAGYSATWLPTNNAARFLTKRDAVKFIKAHEDIMVRKHTCVPS